MEPEKDQAITWFTHTWKIVCVVIIVLMIIGFVKSFGPNDPEFSGVSHVQP